MILFRTLKSTVKIILAAFVVGISVLPVIPQQAAAFDLFGIYLWGKKKKNETPDTIGEPKYYSIEIATAPGAHAEGVKIVKMSSALASQKDKPASRFSRAVCKSPW